MMAARTRRLRANLSPVSKRRVSSIPLGGLSPPCYPADASNGVLAPSWGLFFGQVWPSNLPLVPAGVPIGLLDIIGTTDTFRWQFCIFTAMLCLYWFSSCILLFRVRVFAYAFFNLLFLGGFMKKRFKLSRGRSKKMFSRSARAVHRRNMYSINPMRGGIRL